MDWLGKGSQQFVHYLRSLTPGGQLIGGLLLAILMIIAVSLLRISPSPPQVELFGSRALSGREIARLEAAFAKAGLNDWEVAGNRLRVPRSQRFNYLAAANAENSLPADFDSFLEDMLKNSTPFETRELREMRRNFAMQRELAGIIDALDGVERATVKVNEERAGPFSRDIRRTALVAARSTSGEYLTAMQVDAIRRTIASGTGTPPENIVVTDLRGVAHTGEFSRRGTPPYEHLFSAEKKKYEQYYQEKILRSLSMIPGVVVGVNVELSPKPPYSSLIPGFHDSVPLAASRSPPRTELAGRTSEEPDDQAVGNRPKEVTVSLDENEPPPSGYRLPELAVSDEPFRDASRSARGDMAPGPDRDVRGKGAGVSTNSLAISPRGEFDAIQVVDPTANVTATIQVPRSYFQQIWQRRGYSEGVSTGESGEDDLLRLEREESQRIEETVRNLLPRQDEEPVSHPTVVVQAFTDGLSERGAPESLAHQAVDWFVEHRAAWISLACGILGLIVVPSLLLAIRSSWNPSESATGTYALSSACPEHSDHLAIEGEHRSPRSSHRTTFEGNEHDDADLKRKLLELVRDEPDVAASVLSQWIEDAA